jgi:hypothetical protein
MIECEEGVLVCSVCGIILKKVYSVKVNEIKYLLCEHHVNKLCWIHSKIFDSNLSYQEAMTISFNKLKTKN